MIDTPETPSPPAPPPPTQGQKTSAQQAKKDRLAQALRENLRRRKDQGRQRADAQKNSSES